MNKDELKGILVSEGFDPRVYSLNGGQSDNTLCLSQESGRWCVYFTERGMRFDEEWFNSEDDACQNLLRRLHELPDWETHLPGTKEQ